MDVSVERLYRVTIGDTAHLLEGEDALRLAKSVLTALGIAPMGSAGEVDHATIAADISPPAQLPSGPVDESAEDTPTARPHDTGGKADRPRSAGDKATIEELYTTNVPVDEIAAALGRDAPRIRYMAGYLGLHRTRVEATPPPPRFARTAKAGPAWSEEDDAFLCEERRKGKSWAFIGELLGREGGACKARHGALRPGVPA